MSDSYVMNIASTSIPPEYRANFEKWAMEAFYPLMIKAKNVTGIERYQLLTRGSDYPETLAITFHQSMKEFGEYLRSPEFLAVINDVKQTWGSRFELVWKWSARYQLLKSFQNPDALTDRITKGFNDAPVMQLEGYTIDSSLEQAFFNWLNQWAYTFYVPVLITRIPGIKEYDCYKFIGSRPSGLTWSVNEIEYPQYLSVIHFENPEAYQDYEKSIELAAFRKAVKADFPSGIEPGWNVLYALKKKLEEVATALEKLLG